MSYLLADASVWTNQTLIFWSAIVLICVVPSISYYLYRWRKTELDAELKREMIARGMSADEIERVLAAGGAAPRRTEFPQSPTDETQPYKRQ